MLNIFYQNKTLNDTLIINVSFDSPTVIKTVGDVTIGYCDEKVAFINVTNASKNIDSSLIPTGLLFPQDNLISKIKELSKVDLIQYFDNGFKVAKIEKCEEIAGTHLHKCKVNIGNKVLDIVCGAPNAREGLITVCATNGTMLPDGKLISAGQLLGNKSEGMLCSYKELGIDNQQKGIVELDSKFKVGDYFTAPYSNCNKK
ncbi:MAG: hypothetical protein MJ223_03100 [Mycoplasmoidaceae bacterium]|nr:hypothetical protein [Mycoplasmoidaceae bacterium]